MSRRAFIASLSALAGLPLAGHAQAFLDLDVPYVNTPDNVVLEMLSMGGVQPGDALLDLGSGDGRIVITAALRFGVRGRGIEIDPALVAESRSNARKAGVADKVEFVEQDLFMTDLTQADVITMYLLPDVNIRLRPKLLALRPGVRLVSHDWTMGDWQPDQAKEIAAPQKRLGLRKVANLMAWTVPARVGGRHHRIDSPPQASAFTLQIDQQYQIVTGGRLTIGDDTYRLATQRIVGGEVELHGQRPDGTRLRLSTTLTQQTPDIDWQLAIDGQPVQRLRTRREPDPVKPEPQSPIVGG